MSKCLECGTEFPAFHAGGITKIFCTSACQTKNWNREHGVTTLKARIADLKDQLAEANRKYTEAVSARLEAEIRAGRLSDALDRLWRQEKQHD